MRVRELIEELQKMHPESQVFIDCGFDTAKLDGLHEDDFATVGRVTVIDSDEVSKMLRRYQP